MAEGHWGPWLLGSPVSAADKARDPWRRPGPQSPRARRVFQMARRLPERPRSAWSSTREGQWPGSPTRVSLGIGERPSDELVNRSQSGQPGKRPRSVRLPHRSGTLP